MLLKLALQMARDDYEDRRERQRQGIELAKAAGRYAGRKTDTATHARIVALREGGKSIAETARLAGCSQSQVKRVCAMARPAVGDKKELARSPRCLQAAGLPVVTNVGHLVRRSVTKGPPKPLSTYPRAQRSLLRPSLRWVCGQGTSAGTAQRKGLKPEGVETWNKARCAARKPGPGSDGVSLRLLRDRWR